MSNPFAHVSDTTPTRLTRANPWITALWLTALVFIAAGLGMAAAVSTSDDLTASVVLSAAGSAMLFAGFVGIILLLVVSALRWKP